jgi:putative hemolysin
VAELIVIMALVVSSGIFAGAEIAVVALRKTRLIELAEEGHSSARVLLILREEPERFLATVQVGITVIGATAAAFGGASIAQRLTPLLEHFSWFGEHADDVALGIVVVAVSYLSIVIGELVPKSLALRSAERYALLIARPLYALSWLARPVVWLLSKSANLLLGPFGDTTTFTETRHSAEELQQIVEEATKAGTIHPEAGEIVSRALELPELRARDVMVPRQEIIMIEKAASQAEIRKIVREHSYSRIPVYEERRDNVVGYISLKDVLGMALEQKPISLSEILRPPHFVPDVKRAVELLKEMRNRRVPFAIVVDEQGGIAGIVTLEDLVEELVGDIFNEHTQQAPQLIRQETNGSAVVNGAAPIRDVNRSLGLELPEEGDFTTMGGLVLSLAGRVPNAGEVLTLPDGTTLEVVDVSPRRVRAVRIRPLEPSAAAAV